MKRSVAPSISQGSKCLKVCAGVLSNNTAPNDPPVTLTSKSGTKTRRGTFRWFRYAPLLATNPDQAPMLLVAFAGISGTPAKISDGKLMKLPPPAMALRAPASVAAANKKMACARVKD